MVKVKLKVPKYKSIISEKFLEDMKAVNESLARIRILREEKRKRTLVNKKRR